MSPVEQELSQDLEQARDSGVSDLSSNADLIPEPSARSFGPGLCAFGMGLLVWLVSQLAELEMVIGLIFLVREPNVGDCNPFLGIGAKTLGTVLAISSITCFAVLLMSLAFLHKTCGHVEALIFQTVWILWQLFGLSWSVVCVAAALHHCPTFADETCHLLFTKMAVCTLLIWIRCMIQLVILGFWNR